MSSQLCWKGSGLIRPPIRVLQIQRFEKLVSCSQCTLVDGYAGALFERNTSGRICSFCKKFKKREFLGEQAFLNDISLRADEKVGVTVSGGRDSTYMWLWLVEYFGAERVVALNHHKVGLVHPLANENLRNAEKILCSKLVKLNDYSFLPRFKENLRALLHLPEAAMVRVALCSGCRFGISALLFQEARKNGIKKIVNGASYLELAPFKAALMREKGDGNEIKGLLRGLAENEYYHSKNNLEIILEDHFHRHTTHLSKGKAGRLYLDLSYLDFYDYFPNNPDRIETEVIRKLGWKKPQQEESWHFDCMVEQFKNLFYYGMLGYTEIDFNLSQMIRYNLISRQEALARLYETRRRIVASQNDLLIFLKRIGSEDLISHMKDFIDQSLFLQHARGQQPDQCTRARANVRPLKDNKLG